VQIHVNVDRDIYRFIENFCVDKNVDSPNDMVIRLENYDYCRRDVFGDLPVYEKFLHATAANSSENDSSLERDVVTLGSSRDELSHLLGLAKDDPTSIPQLLTSLWDSALPLTAGIGQVARGYALPSTLLIKGPNYCTTPLHPLEGHGGMVSALIERNNGAYTMKLQLPWGNLALMHSTLEKKVRRKAQTVVRW
jgi:hypothetical protein